MARLLSRAASSSLNALENVLRRQHQFLTSSWPSLDVVEAGSTIETSSGADEIEEDGFEMSGSTRSIWREPSSAAAEIVTLLQKIEEVASDTRLYALQELVRSARRESPQDSICVISSFRATLSYIRASLAETQDRVDMITGASTYKERELGVDVMNASGGLMVASLASLMGLNLPSTSKVILYDLPSSPLAMELLWGRFNRYGRKQNCVMYTFRDEEAAIPLEATLLELHGFS